MEGNPMTRCDIVCGHCFTRYSHKCGYMNAKCEKCGATTNQDWQLGEDKMSEEYWSANDDNEMWTHGDPHEAVQDILSDYNDPEIVDGSIIHIWYGESLVHKASHFIPDIVEYMIENAANECGECSDSWLGCATDELQEAVAKAVDDWCDKTNNQPTFGPIINIKKHAVKIISVDDENWEFIKEAGDGE